jgi:hypothetical protein
MSLKNPWQLYQDRKSWLAALPRETRQTYQRKITRMQYQLIWIAVITMVLLGIFKWKVLVLFPMIAVVIMMYRQRKLQKSLGPD